MAHLSGEKFKQSALAASIADRNVGGNDVDKVEKRSTLYRQIALLRDDCEVRDLSFLDEVGKLLVEPPAGYSREEVQEAMDLLRLNDTIPADEKFTKKFSN